MSTLNWLDYLLILVLGYSAIVAFRKGFSREIVGLVASALAIVLAMWFYGLAGSPFRQLVDSDRVANLIGFVVILIAVWIAGALIGSLLHRLLGAIGLSWFDRLLGAAFGLARGTLIAVGFVTAFMAFGPRNNPKAPPSAMVHSRIAPYLLQASRAAVAIAPKDLKESFQDHYEGIRSAWHRRTAEIQGKLQSQEQ